MRPQVTIIDYGIGNLYSVGRAFEVCGADVSFASEPEQIQSASHLLATWSKEHAIAHGINTEHK